MALMMVQETTDIVPFKKQYIREIRRNGFPPAHRAILEEIKTWLEHDPLYRGMTAEAIQEAIRLHTRLIFMAAFSKCALPPVDEIDRLFVEVFGDQAQAVLSQRIH
jgi:hypothetical protein